MGSTRCPKTSPLGSYFFFSRVGRLGKLLPEGDSQQLTSYEVGGDLLDNTGESLLEDHVEGGLLEYTGDGLLDGIQREQEPPDPVFIETVSRSVCL